MTKRKQNEGTCKLCGKAFVKSSMTSHVKACVRREGNSPTSESLVERFHIVVEDTFENFYWLHLELEADQDLWRLDAYLREIWLECCPHLSMFEIEKKWYNATYCSPIECHEGEFRMDMPFADILAPGTKFRHLYDGGSTTKLRLRVVGMHASPKRVEGAVRLLARNEPLEVKCKLCDEPATILCCEHRGMGDDLVCEAHARKHKCREGNHLPVPDSPRLGTCGYTGPTREF